jgi:acyl-CoA synthetase (AMP-forming)/AMP-acid ligase II
MTTRGRVLQSMADLVERNAALHAQELHRICAERHATFAQFATRSRRLASALNRLGVKSQDRVAILAMNCPEYHEVYGSCEVAPYITAPVNFRLAPPEIAWILKDAAPKVLIFESQYASVLAALRTELPTIQHYITIDDPVPPWAVRYEAVMESGSDTGPPLAPVGSDIHSLMYTSGTTGRPKGVMITHEAMLALGEAWAMELDADLGGRILLAMPLFHIGARSQGYSMTFRGGALVVQRSFDARVVAETIQRERISQLHLAPTLMQQVLDLPEIDRYDFSSLRTINYAAAPMPLTTLKRALRRFGPILINGYGQTEGAGLSLRKAYHRVADSEQDLARLASVGQPIYDTAVKIVDEQDVELAADSVGEICLRSRQNMIGYWNNSVATIEALRGGWLHTGDLGRMDRDGFVYLVDRKKDMIISGGENVYSLEVEEALMAHPAVADVAVIGVPDVKWGEAVKAVVVLKSGLSISATDLVAHCRGQIAGYKCPKSIEFMLQLPRLPSGKSNKVALRRQFSVTGG